MNEAIRAAINSAVGEILEKPTPVTTVIVTPRQARRIQVVTRLEDGSQSTQRVRSETIIALPQGAHADITVDGQQFVIDDYRPRPGHTLGARVTRGRVKETFVPGDASRKVGILGIVTYSGKNES